MNIKDWEQVWSSNFFLTVNKIYGMFFLKNFFNLLKYMKISSKTKIIELGCGSGEILLKLIRKYNFKATLVDNYKPILDKTISNFNENKIKAEFILKDIFKLNFKKKYDIVLSVGLIEHFKGKKREEAFKIHKNLTKRGGYLVIYTPSSSFSYWVGRKINEKLGTWMVSETPFTKKELLRMCKANNLISIKISKTLFGSWFSLLAKRL